VVTETTLKLPPALYFKGIVADENGKPIPAVEISANANTARASGGVERTLSNQDGQFELFNYSAAPFTINNETTKGRVFFSHPNYVSQNLEDVYSVPENERKALRVVLPSGHKIAGTVRDATGNPVARTMIKAASTSGGHRKAALTDAGGRFELKGMPAGATVVSVLALDIKQKAQMPITLDSDKTDLEVRLNEMPLPPNLKSTTVLGMKLTDLTPELKTAYELRNAGGALILDPGQNSERLMIGKLAHGYNFWMVGNKQVASVREFVEQILAEADAQKSDAYSVRVVYSLSTLQFDGTNTQYLKLTKDDVAQLKTVLDQLRSN
jgi:hypothetical protein